AIETTAAGDPNAPAPAGQDAQGVPGAKSLEQQKRDLLVSTALENATALREQGKLEEARAQLEQALQVDPANAVANAQYFEVLELLGERPGDIETTRQMAETRSVVLKQSMKAEADEYFRVGQEA